MRERETEREPGGEEDTSEGLCLNLSVNVLLEFPSSKMKLMMDAHAFIVRTECLVQVETNIGASLLLYIMSVYSLGASEF